MFIPSKGCVSKWMHVTAQHSIHKQLNDIWVPGAKNRVSAGDTMKTAVPHPCHPISATDALILVERSG